MTTVDEIADGIYRISTPLAPEILPGGFSFNQILVVDDEPLLFHTGPRRMFPAVREAIDRVLPVSRLRYIAFSHFEADECGALNNLLALAPDAVPLCGQVNAMVSVADVADRPPRALSDGELLILGRHEVTWIDTPHLPHGWETGYLFEKSTETLFCGDLFTQGGCDNPAITESDLVGPSEAFRKRMDYYSHTKNARMLLTRLASLRPQTLACMHGSSFRGDGALALMELADALGA